MAGHSLGSLIMFDILCNQDPSGTGPQATVGQGPESPATLGDQVMSTVTGGPADHNSFASLSHVETVEQLFDKLNIGCELAANFDGTSTDFIFVLTICSPQRKMFTFSQAHSHTLTNAKRCHKYFRGLSRLLPVPGVLVSFLELHFLGKMALLALRGRPQPKKPRKCCTKIKTKG